MKFVKKKRRKNDHIGTRAVDRPTYNKIKRSIWLVLVVIMAVGTIVWVSQLGKKAQQTVKVVMSNRSIYKNEPISINPDSEMLKPYDMLLGEYEKYSLADDNGTIKRRVVLWDERDKLSGTFAAYPIQSDRVIMYREVVKSRVDNTDSVLYSFPGKDIVPLAVGNTEMEAFKTFLKPGDRINIDANYIDSIMEESIDDYGNPVREEYEVFKTDQVFGGIVVADLLNGSGDSVLDIYSGYNDMSIWQQAQLDRDSNFKESTTPKTLLLALTVEEKSRYDYFLAKANVKFSSSLPQRVDK